MGSYVISVSIDTGCYRHIQIDANATLHEFHEAIQDAFQFDDDHMYAFFMDNRAWSQRNAYFRTKDKPGDRIASAYKLHQVGLSKSKRFLYLFDFGDEWHFQCKVLQELEDSTSVPCIIRSVGESPEQYPDFEDEDDWDEEDDEAWDEEDEEDALDWKPLDEDEFRLFIEKLEADYSIPQETALLIREYLSAAANLYGLIPVQEVYSLYISQNEPISENDFCMAASASALSEVEYTFVDTNLNAATPKDALSGASLAAEYLVSDDPEADVLALRQQQEGKIYKTLPKNEFLKFADPLYFPDTPERAAMLQFLSKSKARTIHAPDELCSFIQISITMDLPFDNVPAMLEADGFRFNKRTSLNEFHTLFKNLNNTTSKHVNCGYSPAELSPSLYPQRCAEEPEYEQISLPLDIPQPPHLTIVGSPSRNAPCPCGSGRKYKNCCGKTNA